MVHLASGEGWYAEQTSAGNLTEKDGFDIEPALARNFLSAAAVIGYEDIFTEDPADYSDRLEEFGLAEPASTVTVTYTDGEQVVMHIGNRSTETEAAYYYMTVDGRKPLYALSVSAAEEWKLPKSSLHPVQQPNLQTARMDQLVMRSGDWTAEWVLEAEITDENASDAWVLRSPVHYPADGTEMTSFLRNIGSIRLGSYVGPAMEERLAEYGLDRPEMILEMHMAEGMAAVTGEDGTVSTTLLKAETVVLIIGSLKSEYVRYVRYGNDVYLVSELTLGPVISKKPMDTVSRYPVLVAAESLTRLTIEDCLTGESTTYRMQRESSGDEEVTRCFENGQEIPFETFEAIAPHGVVEFGQIVEADVLVGHSACYRRWLLLLGDLNSCERKVSVRCTARNAFCHYKVADTVEFSLAGFFQLGKRSLAVDGVNHHLTWRDAFQGGEPWQHVVVGGVVYVAAVGHAFHKHRLYHHMAFEAPQQFYNLFHVVAPLSRAVHTSDIVGVHGVEFLDVVVYFHQGFPHLVVVDERGVAQHRHLRRWSKLVAQFYGVVDDTGKVGVGRRLSVAGESQHIGVFVTHGH